MGQAARDVILRMWEAFERDGLLAALDFASPDAKWRPYTAEGLEFEDTASYRAHVLGMAERDEVVEARLGGIEDMDGCVLVHGRIRMRRPGSLRDTEAHWVHRVEHGRIVYTASFPSREQALAEVKRVCAGSGEPLRA